MNQITIEFLFKKGFRQDGNIYILNDKVQVYFPDLNYTEVYVNADDNPRNYSVHFVNCRTNEDLEQLIRLL